MPVDTLWPRRQWLSALGLLILAQSLGLLLRLQFVKPLAGVNYGFFLHAHSHVALLGWLHALLIMALPRAFLPPGHPLKAYNRLFWFSQLTVLGMLLSFPLQGYAAVSITFSTLSLFCLYAFVWRLLRDLRGQRSNAHRVLRWALWLAVISSLGPWSLGPIMALKLNHSPIYYLAIYFYLHFQYNAWFWLGGLALVLRWLQTLGLGQDRQSQRAASALCWSSLFTLALSALWLSPPLWVWLLGGLGALLQGLGLVWALAVAWDLRRQLRTWLHSRAHRFWLRTLLGLSGLSLMLKILLQALTALPYFARLAAEQRPLIIVYLHLVLLGLLSSFWLACLLQQPALRPYSKSRQWAVYLSLTAFGLGFAGSEALLLYQGLSFGFAQPLFAGFFVALLGFSALMPLGLTGLWLLALTSPSPAHPPTDQEALSAA